MLLFAKWTFPSFDWGDVVLKEDGPVERMSVALWFLGGCWCLAIALHQPPSYKEWLALSVLFLLFGLRELDSQKWLFEWKLDKIANYWNPQIPFSEKILVWGFIIIPAIGSASLLLRSISDQLKRSSSWRTPWIGQILMGGLILLVCVLFDKNKLVLQPLGFELPRVLRKGTEEFGEFILAIYTVSAMWPYWLDVLLGREKNS